MTCSEAQQRTRRLILRERRGDITAREQLAERALRVGLRTAMALLADRERAADVAQDVALIAVRRLHELRDPAAFDAWVHRAAVRESLRARRRVHRRGQHERSLDAAAEVPAADRGVAQVASQIVVTDRIAALPARQRSAVILRYVHDLSDEDIARALSCRKGTVHALLSRARAALRNDPAIRDVAAGRQGNPDGR